MAFMQSGADSADTEGPNASLESGQATQAQGLANSLKPFAPAAYAASQTPGQQGQAGPGGAPPPGGAPGGAPQPHPVQPAPQRPPLTPDTVNNQTFTPPQQIPYPHRVGLIVAAMHPNAGPYT